MMIVRMLRWLFGYIRFSVDGSFPERFLNAAARRGVNLWGLTRENGFITAMTRQSEKASLFDIAQKTDTTIQDIQYFGCPHRLRQYRYRCGLLVGLILCGAGCHILSGMVWSISVRTPALINEYEVRQMLAEEGLTEGTPTDSIDVSDMIHQLSVNDKRISWMTVNITDTHAEVNISPNLNAVVEQKEAVPLSNMKSIADGTVTKVEVYQGTANVKVGDGIRKNQLLVSGLMEYTNGQVVLTDCEAHIFAKTYRSVEIRLPKEITRPEKQESITKSTITAFGLSLPLTLNGSPEQPAVFHTQKEQLSLFGQSLPIYITTESWYRYQNVPAEMTPQQAQKLLQQKLSLYEFFMLSSTHQGRILQRHDTVKETDEAYFLQAEYEIEEDVCEKSVVPLSADESNDPVGASVIS